MANTILTKQDKPKILNYFPTKQYGQEGDIVISKIKGKGIFFCIKASGAWYAQTTMQPLNKINDVFIKHLKSEKITLKNIKESEITAEKFLISSNGNIRYRTADGILNDLGLGNINSFVSGAFYIFFHSFKMSIKIFHRHTFIYNFISFFIRNFF